MAVFLMLYSLQKGETEEYKIDWSHSYGKLPKGEYRLIKYFYFEDKDNKIEGVSCFCRIFYLILTFQSIFLKIFFNFFNFFI